MVPSPASSSPEELIIGTYTESLPHVNGQAAGILSCRYEAGTIGPVRVLARTRNPSFLVLSPDSRRLYAVNETVEFEGQPGGGVTAFTRDPRTGDLSPLNTRPSGGVEPAHLELAPGGNFLLVANYRSGSVAVVRARGRRQHWAHDRSRAAPGVQRPSGTPERSPRAHDHVRPGPRRRAGPRSRLDAVLFYTLSTRASHRTPGAADRHGPPGVAPGTSPSIPTMRTCCAPTSWTTRSWRCAARRWLHDHRYRVDFAGGIPGPQSGRGDPGVAFRSHRARLQSGSRQRHDRRLPFRRG